MANEISTPPKAKMKRNSRRMKTAIPRNARMFLLIPRSAKIREEEEDEDKQTADV